MASTISTLNSSFTSLISSLMTIERQPLTMLTEKKEDITVQQAVYSDLSKSITDFKSAVSSLISTKAEYSFTAQRKATVSGVAAGSTVLTASASSSSVPAQYQVAVTSLAKAHQVRSDRQISSSAALNLTGSFLLRGDLLSSASITESTISNTLSGAAGIDIENGQSQLSSGTYSVETRYDAVEGWQFRMVDSAAAAVSIRKQDGSYSSDWQKISAGLHDTGRGIQLNFAADPLQYTAGTSKISFTAKGTKINVSATDTLVDVAYAINNATYEAGEEITATIIDNQLVLSRKTTGSGHTLTARDQEGNILTQLGVLQAGVYKNEIATPSDAVFTVNNLSITRSSNTGLTDVIQGVTLNLAADAEGKNATIDVKYDSSNEKSVLSTFMARFNNLQSYLSTKLATVKLADGTYKRGALAGDIMLQGLRMEMIQGIVAETVNSGSYLRLSDIGITMSDTFSLSISDSTKLEQALSENKKDVTALMDTLMTKMESKLTRYLGTSGYVSTSANALTKQLELTNSQISTMNDRLATKEESLRQRYGEIQATLTLMQYQQQQFSAIYGVINQYS